MNLGFLKKIGAVAAETTAKALFKMKKNSPELLIAGGIVLVVAGTVVACTRTSKAQEILAEKKEAMEEIEAARSIASEAEYSRKEYKIDKLATHIKYSGKLALCYLPAGLIEGAGIACFLGAYGIMKKRQAILMAAYEALSTAYVRYRTRVKEEFGEETEEAIYHGRPLRRVTEGEPAEFGDMPEEKKSGEITEDTLATCDRYQKDMPSPYARFFDENSPMFRKDPESNLAFLRMLQKQFNNRLYLRGFITLNEVYEALGIPETNAGCIMGWLKNKANEPTKEIDFGIYKGYQEGCRDFVNGYERSILLDFNVDPEPIWDKI